MSMKSYLSDFLLSVLHSYIGITDLLLNFFIGDLQNQADYGRFEVLLTSSSRISNCVVWYRGTNLPNYKTLQKTKILRLIMV